MPLPYNHVHDLNGAKGDGLRISDLKFSATITAAAGDTTLVVPSSSAMGLPAQGRVNHMVAKIVVESGAKVWFSTDELASVPVGANFASVTSELLVPEKETFRVLTAASVMHFITADVSADVSIAFYSL